MKHGPNAIHSIADVTKIEIIPILLIARPAISQPGLCGDMNKYAVIMNSKALLCLIM